MPNPAKSILPLTLLLTPACGATQVGPYLLCQQTLAPIEADDASLGFTANEVLALLQAAPPEQIEWDELTLTDGTDTLRLDILGIADEVQLATPEGDGEFCPGGGVSLLIPVQVEVVIGGDEVVSTGILPVYAGALDLAAIHMEAGWQMPAELTGSYETAFQMFFESEYASQDLTLDGVYITTTSVWSEGAMDIAFKASGAEMSLAGTAWRGHWRE